MSKNQKHLKPKTKKGQKTVTSVLKDRVLLDLVNTPVISKNIDKMFAKIAVLTGARYHGSIRAGQRDVVFAIDQPKENIFEEALREVEELRRRFHLGEPGRLIAETDLEKFRGEVREILGECVQRRPPLTLLNQRVRQVHMRFNIFSSEYEPDIVFYNPKSSQYAPEDFDLRIQITPAIINFLFRNIERMGKCEHPACEAFFIAKRKGRKKFCSDDCKRLYWQDVRAKSGYHREDMRRRRNPNTPGFEKYIR